MVEYSSDKYIIDFGAIVPQLLLELSSNIIEKNNLALLFQECHSILVKLLPTSLDNCKSRSIEHSHFYIGNDDPNNAFVSIVLKVMPGRSPDTLAKVSHAMLSALQNYFAESLKKLNCQISLEMMELQETYYKIKG